MPGVWAVPRRRSRLLLVPIVACLLGLVNSYRMLRLPDVKPSTSLEGLDLG